MDETTIKALFTNIGIHFEIPQYQRAYSWGKAQWEQFLIDLNDAGTSYYLGHYLFENDGTNSKRLIIDGQQRLTTCVIFVRSAMDILANEERFSREVKCLETIYLKNELFGPRFKTVRYDDPVFQNCIVDGQNAPTVFKTNSAKNIIEAKKYFTKQLRALGGCEKVEILLNRMESAIVTTYDVSDRAMAAHIFAYQNDRGKQLTKLEKIKSHLMLTIVTKSKTSQVADAACDRLDTQFASIYETIARLNDEVDEDEILAHYWKSCNGFYAADAVDGVKQQISKTTSPLMWVQTFVSELADAFTYAEGFYRDNSEYPVRLRLLNNLSLSFPFLVRAHLHKITSESTAYISLLKLLENVTFRSLIRGGRADMLTRLNVHLLRINDDTSLKTELNSIVSAIANGGWGGYWSDGELSRHLAGLFYQNRVDNYLLWQYELSLYGQGYTHPIAVTPAEMMKNESIEHIAPQTSPGDEPAAGYGLYIDKTNEEDGIESGGWMNRLGNLVLASQSQNSSLGNKPFAEKLRDYSQCILKEQSEIQRFAQQDEGEGPKWTVDSIRNRQKTIVDWAMKYWNIRNTLS